MHAEWVNALIENLFIAIVYLKLLHMVSLDDEIFKSLKLSYMILSFRNNF